MKLTYFGKNISDYEIYLLETSKGFLTFLEKFWVHWIIEYDSFLDWEKKICLEEFLKRK